MTSAADRLEEGAALDWRVVIMNNDQFLSKVTVARSRLCSGATAAAAESSKTRLMLCGGGMNSRWFDDSRSAAYYAHEDLHARRHDGD